MDRTVLGDGIKVLLLIIMLTFIVMYVPVLNILGLLIWPIPVVFIFLRHGMQNAVKLILIAAIVNSLLLGPLMGLITIIGFGFIGFIIGSCLEEEISPLKTLMATIGVVLVSHVVLLVLAHFFLGFEFEYFIQEFETILEQTSELGQFQDVIQLELFKKIIPGLIVTSSIVTGILQYYITIWYLQKKNFSVKIYSPLKLWSFPRLPIFFGLFFSLLFLQNTVFINLGLVLFFLLFIQGLAVGLYLIDEKLKSRLLKVVFIFSVFFLPFVSLILTVVGLLDMWFNLRKI